MDYLIENNLNYSKKLLEWSQRINARFIYASSAATYGNGEDGFDDMLDIEQLKPINRYGYSKHLFDLWVKRQNLDNKVVGLKFFNVFGPNEYHKGSMQSIIQKSVKNVKENKCIQLFKSYHEDFKDGDQRRDFIYVKDSVNVINWFLKNSTCNGLFNLGTGKSRTWNELAQTIYDLSANEEEKKEKLYKRSDNVLFKTQRKKGNIAYIDMPLQLKEHYQYFTEAKMDKLTSIGCTIKFKTLEESMIDYIKNYIIHERYLGQ